MPSKLNAYAQMAEHAATQITGSHLDWTAFLTTAARLYKYPYNEQLMIFVQRPSATACAEYDFWNDKMRRYVRRGSKGIALIDATRDKPRLKYVFDVADTGGGDNSRRPFLWELRPEHTDSVTAMLERNYEVSGENGLADQLERIAAQMADEYWNDHQYDILRIVDDSFLEEYDDFNIGVAFRTAATVSITYALQSRCGLEPENYFTHEDFLSIFDFNTPSTVAALGTAVSQINQRVLRQIEVTIKKYEREHSAERTAEHGEQPDLHAERGLPDSRPDALGAAGDASRQVREDAKELPEGASPGAVEQPVAVGETVPAPVGDRADGEQPLGEDDAGADESGGRDGSPESQRPDEVGGPDEQLQGTGRGNSAERTDLQLNEQPEQLSLFPTEGEQIQRIAEAESVKAPSAFSMPVKPQSSMWEDYEAVKEQHPDDIVLYQVGDFFEMFGEDAETAAAALDINLTSRAIPGAECISMCGIPSHRLEQYVEKLQDVGHDVVISGIEQLSGERRVFFLPSIDHEAERAIDAHEAEYGADGWRAFPGNAPEANPPQPVVQGLVEQYKPSLIAAVEADESYRNACRNSDKENAYMEGAGALSRAVLASDDMELIRLYFDTPKLQAQLEKEVLDETYPKLHEQLRPISQEDIDDALRAWNGDADSKRAVVRYMVDHARDKDTAAWLASEYGTDAKALFVTRTGADETVELSWAKVQRRIAQLIQSDAFYTDQELDSFEDIDPVAIRENLAEHGIVGGQVVDEAALDSAPIVQQAIKDAGDKPRAPTMEDVLAENLPVLVSAVMENDAYRNACHIELRADAFAACVTAIRQALPDMEDGRFGQFYENFNVFKQGVHNRVFDETYPTLSVGREGYPYDVGEEFVFEDGKKYIITRIEGDTVRLMDTSIKSPRLPHHREVSRDELLRLVEQFPQAASEQYEDAAVPEVLSEQRDPLAPAYKLGDTVYLDDKPFEITEVNDWHVQLRDPSLYYPIFRAENKENFERLLRRDARNGAITDFLPAELDITYADLQDALTGDGGLLRLRDKEIIAGWFRSGEGNTSVAQRLSETYAGTAETMTLLSGETADFFATTTAFEINIQDKSDTKLSFSWNEIAPVLRAMYQQERDGFSHEPVSRKPVTLEGEPSYQVGDKVYLDYGDKLLSGTVGHVGDIDVRIDTGPYSWSYEVINREQFEDALRHDERNAELFTTPTKPEITTETVAVYPAEQNNLPYDIVIERLHIEEPEHDPPKIAPLDTQPVAENFRITDDALGAGGQKAKYGYNVDAIRTLQTIEAEGRMATPEEQEILSRYVGWGGLPQVFDRDNAAWTKEYAELKGLLTAEEYGMARASTLNAHYTSPTVIRAIYETIGNMGFTTGNILEPSMGVGNFFGLLPDSMADSKLYGVELDSLTGRIAKQLYPNANITISGFEKTDRRDFFDLAVGNVPFGSYKVADRAFDQHNFFIHDYFFAKTLDQMRPGGVIAFITSKGTMDKQSPEVRRYIAERAELLGAVRLPNNAFKANAGTEVTTDIIFLQKRDRPIEVTDDWLYLSQTDDGIPVNSYFAEHPDMVLGRMAYDDSMYGDEKETACLPTPGADLATQLAAALSNISGQYAEAELPELGEGEEIDTSIPADPDVKNYSYAVRDGEVYYRENSRMVRPDLNATAKERVKGMVELRDCVHKLIGQQLDGFISDAAIRQTQAELNRLYDAFTDRYGLLNSRGNSLAFSDDSSYYLLCSLEVLDEDGNLERKADMFSKRTIKQQRVVTSVDTASEALALSIAEKARVDMEYMSSLTGKTEDELASELRGVIFLDFNRKSDGSYTYRTADDFLSGNVREKLAFYERASAYTEGTPKHEAVLTNVEALRAAQPKDLDASEIEVRLGATWIDKGYIQEFMEDLLDPPYYLRGSINVNYSEFTAEWNITGKSIVGYNNINAYMTYGTERANAYRILEDTLNLRDVRIYDTKTDPDGKERRVLNSKETTLAQQKQQAIKDAFRDWIWKDPERRRELVAKYNELFNSSRPREYDGRHISFSGMNPEITLREHQLNAVAHILYGGNTLLAHEVGAGKTFEMVAAAMESKRLGLCQKSLFAVPNHLTEQWASEFLRLYPSANILVATRKDFETRNRKKFCARIATGDYDAVIIGHSQFERIPVSQERQERLLQEQIWEIEDGLEELKASRAERFTIKQLERTKKSLEARLEKLMKNDRKDSVVTFEQLGVDRLYVDEAHSFKNLFLYTKMRNVAGLSTSDAQKSSDMLLKCRCIDEITEGKGVIFATGTPVSNSMTELYTMMRYLQHDMLQQQRLTHFDCWASTFGETQTAIELAPEGTGYRARTRFAKFFNLPELMTLFKEAADIKTADQLNLPTPKAVYHNEVAQPTELQREMVRELSERAAAVHTGNVDPSVDNMLKITSDGRKLGLDQRVINPDLPDNPDSKVNMCVNNIHRIWQDGQPDKLTQLVFCDLSTPKGNAVKAQAVAAKAGDKVINGVELHALENMLGEATEPEQPFSIYDDIREKLVARGVPREQIAFIHEANTEVRKKELFAKARSGQVRVLMGSTFKMGAGMNVQDRLVALHDLDCPWRPGDLEQRSGRIIRQGNKNDEVHIYRYVTEATFDAYLWQTVENKQKFISQIMTSKSPVRSCEDIDETALSYAEIKALCAGDERVKEKMNLDTDVARLRLMKANHQSQQYRLEDNLLRHFPEQIERDKGFIAGFEADMATLAAHPHPTDGFAGMEVKGDFLTDKDNAGAAILEAFKEAKGLEPVPVGSYRGFAMSLTVEDFGRDFVLTLKGQMSHRVSLGKDARGNLIRIDNALNGMPERLQAVKERLDNTHAQMATAKAEIGKPFPQEDELRQKSMRLAELNAELNIDDRTPMERMAEDSSIAKTARPSVLDKLKSQPVRSTLDKAHKKEMEAR